MPIDLDRMYAGCRFAEIQYYVLRLPESQTDSNPSIHSLRAFLRYVEVQSVSDITVGGLAPLCQLFRNTFLRNVRCNGVSMYSVGIYCACRQDGTADCSRYKAKNQVPCFHHIRKHFISEAVAPSPYCKNTFFCLTSSYDFPENFLEMPSSSPRSLTGYGRLVPAEVEGESEDVEVLPLLVEVDVVDA